MVRLLDIITVAMIIGFFVLYLMFGKQEHKIKKSFTVPVIFLLSGVLLSTLPAYYFHGQSFGITLYQQRYMYAFLFYFLLFYLFPKPDFIFNLILYLALFAGVFFIVQYVIYPARITDAKIFMQRGTIRMNLPGMYLMHIGFFLSSGRFLTEYRLKYGLIALLLLLVAILSGFRSILALYLLISAGILLFNKTVKNRFLIFSLYFIFLVAGFFSFQSIIIEMKTSAEKESTEGTSNIRYRAAEYFVGNSINENMTMVLGNGVPSERSSYGRKLALISLRQGYYLSDIGIAGFYFKFGLLSSIMVLFILLKVILSGLPEKISFIRYFFLFQFALIFNTTLAFDSLPDIILVCFLLYLYDVRRSSPVSEELVKT